MMKNHGFTPILILVIILVVAGVAFVLGQSLKTSPAVTITGSPSPKAMMEDVSDWKTYSNTAYHYSIDYPTNWKANSAEPGPGEVSLNTNSRGLTLFPDIYSSSIDAKTYIQIETDGDWNLSAPSYEDWISKGRDVFYTVTNRSNITFEGGPAAVVTGTYGGYGSPAAISTTFFTSPDKKTYYSIATVVSESELGEVSQMLDQILSTFKFTQ